MEFESQHDQNVVVMRHGDRIDQSEPLWTATADRPWDPPLIQAGKVRAFCSGKKLRSNSGFRIHRVVVSPFLRCVQTAAAAVSALCAVGEILPEQTDADGLTFDSSKIKVSIEYGLCEMLNRQAIRGDVAPKDGKFSFNIAELEAMFPDGTVDHSVEPVYRELPKWEETVSGTRTRYTQIVKSLADKYPAENLLLVTHVGTGTGISSLEKVTISSINWKIKCLRSIPALPLNNFALSSQGSFDNVISNLLIGSSPYFRAEGVGVALSAFMKGITVYEVEYCGNVHLKREVSFGEDKSFTAGDFEVVRPLTGISLIPSNVTVGDPLAQPDIV